MFFNSKEKFGFRGPIKSFKLAPPELDWSCDGKGTIF